MRMGFPPAAQRLIGLMQLEDGLANSQRPKAYSGPRNFRAEAEQMGRILFLSPTIGIYWNNYDWEGVSTGTVRMRFEAARVALAIERYRLAQGKLPETLDRLVPTYLSEVPKDYFATGGAPLSYRVRPNGSYAVYSIGQDGKDTLDVDQGKLRTNDEIVFQVASQNARLGPQIASE